MEYREKVVVFRKYEINHIARIITYIDVKKSKRPRLVSLLTNDFDMPSETIVEIYRRWQIESLFKQIKQNFPLRYFYGESQHHQDTDMGDAHRKPAPFSLAEQAPETLELLRTGHNGANCADVLHESRKIPQ